MSRFQLGIDSEEPDKPPEPWPRFRSDGTGIRMTPFAQEINGIPVAELHRVDAEGRKRINKIDQHSWRELAARCWKIGAIEKPRLRAMAAQILLGGMHAGDPPDLEEYAEATGNSTIDAADELSPVGGFEEKPYGIVTGEVHWDGDDIPEPTEDDDDDGEIASVEA
jgi:hypothetical protein